MLVVQHRLDQVEETIDAISGVVNGIVQTQALFTYKHEEAKQANGQLQSYVDKLLAKNNEESTKIFSMFVEQERALERKMIEYKDAAIREIKLTDDRLDKRFDVVIKNIEEVKKSVSNLQRWAFIAMGGGAVVVFLIERGLSLIS